MFWPSTLSSATLLPGNFAASARLPSGVNATAETISPIGTYVGNYADNNISVLRVDGDKVTDTGKTVPLPGSPASMRGRVQ